MFARFKTNIDLNFFRFLVTTAEKWVIRGPGLRLQIRVLDDELKRTNLKRRTGDEFIDLSGNAYGLSLVEYCNNQKGLLCSLR